MNKKLLCGAVLGAIFASQSVTAQDFDDRWYVSAMTGYNLQDSTRHTDSAPFIGLGFGKFFSPEWSLDLELNHQNPSLESNGNLNWSQYGVEAVLRRHFRSEGRNWWPYVLAGAGLQRAEEEYDAFPNVNSPGQRKDNNLAVKLGGGLQADYGRTNVRAELAYRADFDDRSFAGRDENWFGDLIASVGVTVALGPEPAEPVAPTPEPVAPPPPEPEVKYCPDGSVMGPEGCPVPLTIDLRGVNFDFDKSVLRADAVAILDEAIAILKKYTELRVEVAGHTDLCGPEKYNQGLSERRAKAVYDYLTSNGIDASRLAGPVGYGESRPLEPTAQTFPACKSETNRRTELNVQNQ